MPVWVAPLVAPAVDLSVIGLLLGTRHLALAGAPAAVLRPARRLLIFASVVTLALNVADPLVAGEYGKAAFDAVGPLLLIGWAEVGPGFLQAIGESGSSIPADDAAADQPRAREHVEAEAGSATDDQGEVDRVEQTPLNHAAGSTQRRREAGAAACPRRSRRVPSLCLRPLADALVRLAALDEPPARFAAGADAVTTFEQKANTLLAQADAHRELSTSLAHT